MKPSRNTIYIILGLLVLVLFGYFFDNIMVYLTVSVVLMLLSRPIRKVLSRINIRNRKMPSWLVAAVTLFVLYGLISGIVLSLFPVLGTQTQKVADIDPERIQQGLKVPIQAIQDFLLKYDFVDKQISPETYIDDRLDEIIRSSRPSTIAAGVISLTGDIFIGLFAITFITFFFIKEPRLFPSILLTLVPEEYEDRLLRVLESTRDLLTRYFIGIFIEVLLVGSLVALGLSILGIEDAIAIGFFAGLFNIIPYLGPLIGALFGVLLTLMGNLGLDFYSDLLPLTAKVLLVFGIVQLIDNMFFQPMIYSSSVKAHPLEIFIVIMMGGTLGGAAGMIVAVPVYTVLRVIAKEFFSQFKVVQSLTGGI